MAIKALLGRLIVIGGYHELRIGAGFLRVASERDGLLGRVRAGAGDDRNAALGHLDAEGGHPVMLLMAQDRRFAGRPAGDEPMAPLLDLPIDEVLKGTLIDLAVAER